MAPEGPERASQAAALTSLPRVEDLPSAADGYDREKVREAFEAFRRHTTQLQVSAPRAAGRRRRAGGADRSRGPDGRAAHDPGRSRDGGHDRARRADSLGRAAAPHRGRGPRRQRELQGAGRRRPISPGERAPARRDAERRQERGAPDEAGGAAAGRTGDLRGRVARHRLLEQARHQATELTNATRAEVEQTLEWARGQAGAIIARAQEGAEQLLGAAVSATRRWIASRSRSSAPRRPPPSEPRQRARRPPAPPAAAGA